MTARWRNAGKSTARQRIGADTRSQVIASQALFLGRDPASTDKPWSEFQLQCYVIQQSRRAGYMVHGDQNGADKSRTSASNAKASGMLAGWPDTCFAVPSCPVYVELKLADGALSAAQKNVHAHMAEMGYPIQTVYAASPADAWTQVQALLPLMASNIPVSGAHKENRDA